MKSAKHQSLSKFILLCILGTTIAEPLSSFFDGSDSRNECKPRLDRRITGLSGLLYSHSKYGKEPYNVSRNCVLMLVAPIGYQIRVRALQFDVTTNDSASCEKDTLHVFDHESAVDPESYAPPRIDDITSPGPIIGQFCGHITEKILNASSQNAMTLWWHANPNITSPPSKGFKLHWNAYRISKNGKCHPDREFSCGNNECIPKEIACDRHADCSNGADLIRDRQIAANCQSVDLDPLVSISGVSVLLISAMIVLLVFGFGILVCCCCRAMRKKTPVKGANSTVTCEYKPDPPQFYPPSPPKMPPPSAASSFTPRKQPNFENIPTDFRGVRVLNNYGGANEVQGDYTYVRNDVHRNLI